MSSDRRTEEVLEIVLVKAAEKKGIDGAALAPTAFVDLRLPEDDEGYIRIKLNFTIYPFIRTSIDRAIVAIERKEDRSREITRTFFNELAKIRGHRGPETTYSIFQF